MERDGWSDEIPERTTSITASVLAFCERTCNSPLKRFRARELHQAVEHDTGLAAPGSADRILREMRKAGRVNYRLISKYESLYEMLPAGVPPTVQGKGEGEFFSMEPGDMDGLDASRRAAAIVEASPLLQARNTRGAGSEEEAKRLAKEAGVSASILHHAATVWRRDRELFARVQRGEISVWAASEASYRARQGPAPLSLPPSALKRQDRKDKSIYKRAMELVYHLEGTAAEISKLDLEAARRGGSLEFAAISLQKSRRLIKQWECAAKGQGEEVSHGTN